MKKDIFNTNLIYCTKIEFFSNKFNFKENNN